MAYNDKAEIARLHAFIRTLAGKLADAAEVLAHLAERKQCRTKRRRRKRLPKS